MAVVREDPPMTDAIRLSRFKSLKHEGYAYMVEMDQTIRDEYMVTASSAIEGIRASNIREDLRAIYNQIGDIYVRKVYDLSADFNTRVGGLEMLPVYDVIAVHSEMAVRDYQRKVANIGFWDRVRGRYPEV